MDPHPYRMVPGAFLSVDAKMHPNGRLFYVSRRIILDHGAESVVTEVELTHDEARYVRDALIAAYPLPVEAPRNIDDDLDDENERLLASDDPTDHDLADESVIKSSARAHVPGDSREGV